MQHAQKCKKIKEIEEHIIRSLLNIGNIHNFHLKNAYLFGKWLQHAVKLFRYKKIFFKKFNFTINFCELIKTI